MSCINTFLCPTDSALSTVTSSPTTMSANNFWGHAQQVVPAKSTTTIKSEPITIKREPGCYGDPITISPIRTVRDRVPVTPPQEEKPKIVRPWEMSPVKQRTASVATPTRAPLVPLTWSSTPYNVHVPLMPWISSPPYAPQPTPYGLMGAYGHVMSPTYLGSPMGRCLPMLPGNATPSDDSGFQSFNNSSGDNAAPSPKEKDGKGCRKHLSPRAIQLMEEWYRLNFDHPYPSNDMIEYFAAEGSISIVQVKKWMANKRVRSFNTLSFNGSIHPKRLKRLQRMSLMRSVTSRHATPRDTGARLESFTSVQLLNQWYQEHADCPYPSEQEKEDLAKRCGIHVMHVTSWLDNRRSSTPPMRQTSTTCHYGKPSLLSDKARVRNVSCRLDFQPTDPLVHHYCH